MMYRLTLVLHLVLFSVLIPNVSAQCDCGPVRLNQAGSGPDATPFTSARHDQNYASIANSINCMLNCIRYQQGKINRLEDSLESVNLENQLLQDQIQTVNNGISDLSSSLSSKIDSLGLGAYQAGSTIDLVTVGKPCESCKTSGVAESPGFLLGTIEIDDITLDAIGAMEAIVGTQRVRAAIHCVGTTCISTDYFLVPVPKGVEWSVSLLPELTRTHDGNLAAKVVWIPLIQHQ